MVEGTITTVDKLERYPMMTDQPGVQSATALWPHSKHCTNAPFRIMMSSSTVYRYTLILFLCVLLLIPGTLGCSFPKFLQSTAMWMSHNTKGNRAQGYFQDKFMTASRCDSDGSNCVHTQIKCLVRREDNKFMVKHSNKLNGAPEYSCMQIIRRSDNIIQIRESQRQIFRNPNACNNEHLILDNWPMTNSQNFERQKIPCPFAGGYNVRFHTSDKDPMCAKEVVPTRLESECEAGDGMTLKFSNEACIHKDLGMEMVQHLYCAASWTHGNNTFVAVRPQDDKYNIWCMRFHGTDLNREVRHAEIFMDFVCDPGDGLGILRETSNYLSVEFDQRIISTTCADSYLFCEDERLCDKAKYSKHCRKVCGQCSGHQDQCNFLPKFEGEWIEQARNGKETVRVTPYMLAINNHQKFTCHEKDMNHDFVNDTLLLQTFENGCFPRYSCLEIRKPFSSILEYRIGNRVSWPVENWDALRDDVCDESMFLANKKDKEIYGKSVIEKPMKILVDPKYHYRVSCGFDEWPGFNLNNVYMQNQNGCDVCLVHDHKRNHDSVITQSLNCSSESNHQQFHCMGVFPQDDSTHAVVTRTLHKHQEYRCWVFVHGHQRPDLAGTVYVLESSFCNSVAIEAVKEGSMQPLEIYNIPKSPPRPCPYLQVDKLNTPYPTRAEPPRRTTERYDEGPSESRTWPDPNDQERTDNILTQPPGPHRPFPPVTYDPNRAPPSEIPKSDELNSSANNNIMLKTIDTYVCLVISFLLVLLHIRS